MTVSPGARWECLRTKRLREDRYTGRSSGRPDEDVVQSLKDIDERTKAGCTHENCCWLRCHVDLNAPAATEAPDCQSTWQLIEHVDFLPKPSVPDAAAQLAVLRAATARAEALHARGEHAAAEEVRQATLR